MVPVLEPGVIFDVGAGVAVMRGPAEQVGLVWYGFDLESQTSKISRCDFSYPCPRVEPKAGMVLLMDVLEHLENPGLALDHIADVISDGGYILLSTPNPRCSRSRLEALWTEFPTCFTNNELVANHHVFLAWPHVLEYMLKKCAFEILEWCQLLDCTRIPKPALQAHYPLRVMKALVCRLVEACDPSAVGIGYAVLAKKR